MDSRKVNGVNIYAPDSAHSLIDFAFTKKAILVAVNAEKILHATSGSRKIINRNVGYPDGFGAVLALKKVGIHNVIKIPGCELWLEIIKCFYLSKSFYLVGGRQDVIQKTVTKLQENFKGINIVNYRDGYLSSESEVSELILDIKKNKPDIVFVAMGSPTQESLMERMQQEHPALYQGLGGSFDVYNGNVKRASPWWVKNNLEWLYRLIMQPTRIKRQVHLIKFLFLLLFTKWID